MSLHGRLVSRYIYLFIAVTLALALIWCLLWTLTAAQFRNRFDAWIEATRAQGSDINYDARSVTGFPGHVVMQIDGLRWHNAFGAHAEMPSLEFSVLPFSVRKLKWSFQQGMSLTILLGDKSETATIHADKGEGALRAADGAQWRYFNASLSGISGTYDNRNTFVAADMRMIAERPDVSPASHAEVGMNIDWQADKMTVVSTEALPFGNDIDHVEASLHVMGAPPSPYDKSAVTAWNNESGILECENLQIRWGPLALTAKGTIGLDDDLQPEGAFAGAIDNHEQVLQALLATDWVPKRQAAMLNSALGLFSRPSTATGGPGIELPITVQLGGVFLGPIRIFTFPDIIWPIPQVANAPVN